MALQGLDPVEERNRRSEEQALTQLADSMANELSTLDDKGFNETLQRMQTEMMSRPEAPVREDRGPGALNVLASGLASMADPGYAADYMSIPFNEATRRNDADYKTKMGAYEGEVAGRKDRLGQLANMATLQRQQYSDQYGRIQDAGKIRMDAAEGAADRASREAINATTQTELTKRNTMSNETRRIGFESQESRDFLKSILKLTPGGRVQAAIDRGYSAQQAAVIGQMTMGELAQLAGVDLKKAQTDLTKAKTQTENELRADRKREIQSRYKLNDKRAELVAKQVFHYSAESAGRVARANAYVDGVRSLIKDRLDDNERAAFEFSVEGMRDGLKAHNEEATNARERIQDLTDEITFNATDHTPEELTAMREELKVQEEIVKTAQEAYGELAKEVEEAVKAGRKGDTRNMGGGGRRGGSTGGAGRPRGTSGTTGGGMGAGAGYYGLDGGPDDLGDGRGGNRPVMPELEVVPRGDARVKEGSAVGGIGAMAGKTTPKKKKPTEDAKKYGESKGIKFGG